MRHMMKGRQLSRDTEHRKALRRNLIQSLFEHGMVKTTYPKAKEVKALAEKLITLARLGTLTARRRVIATLRDRRLVDEKQDFTGETVVQKLFNEIAPNFKGRDGGYTRIIKTAKWRIGDGGDIVQLQLLTVESKPTGTAKKSLGLRRKRNERKHAFAGRILKEKKGSSKAEAQPAAPVESSAPAAQ